MIRQAVWSGVVLVMAACAPAPPHEDAGALPAGVSCNKITIAHQEAELELALAGSAPGSCVVVADGTYGGSFFVPQGVKLLAQEGARVGLSGDGGVDPALTVTGGAGSGVYGLRVGEGYSIGVKVENGPATLVDLFVTGATLSGVSIECSRGTCADPVTLTRVTADGNAAGLVVYGSTATMSGGALRRSVTTTLASGYGGVVGKGGSLELSGTTVELNSGPGLYIDGSAGRTDVHLRSVTVRGNRAHGVYVRSLAGSLADPWLSIEDTLVEDNQGGGIVLVGAHGVVIADAGVRGTRAVPVVIDLGHTDHIGDGLTVGAGSGDVRLDGLTLEGNARCQALIDHADGGVTMVRSRVSTGDGGLYLVVVQASPSADVPSELISDAGVELSAWQ